MDGGRGSCGEFREPMAMTSWRPLFAAGVLLLSAATVSAQSLGMRTYCNPIDIDYRYGFEQLNTGASHRSGADPVIVPFKGQYVLFETIAGGYWISPDLRNWAHVTPSRWPMEDVVAPAALAFGDTILLLQSAYDSRPILYTTAPETGRLEFYNRWLPQLPGMQPPNMTPPGPPNSVPPGPWDPALFRDDDGRWFMYWGSSNYYPIYGIELDPTRRLAYKHGEIPKPLLSLHPKEHGWERFGRDHRDTITPYVEGAWMTKHGGRYYLQYGAPGTEYNGYANGTYVGGAPLGPFTYAPYNPVSYKPGGWFTGVGHGNTFQDNFGNYWNTGTGWIGLNGTFERRIMMVPAGFDADGQMFASTRFGDFPQWLPTKKWSSPDELFTGWMLLSYRKPATASSVRDSFPTSNITDENNRTFWVARTNSADEWVAVDLQREYDVKAIQVSYTDYQNVIFTNDSTVYTQFRLSHSRDGTTWAPLADLSREPRRDRPNAYIELPSAVRTRYVRYEHGYVAGPNLAISDIRIFGNGSGKPPATPAGLSVQRDTDARNAFIRWKPVRGAVGYNVLWGIASNKLYQTYQRFADEGTPLEIRALNVGQDYWFAVEAFDENGVSQPSKPVHAR